MDTIKNYLETMFINLPETAEMLRLKADIFENMQDRYNELKEKDKSENEAIGVVISEFGNINEILEAMDIHQAEQSVDKSDILPVVDREVAEKYLDVKRKVALNIGLGLVFCAFGVASLLLSIGIFGGLGRSVILGLVPLFLLTAIGVGLFILGGLRNAEYSYLDQPFVLSKDVRKNVEELKQAYVRTFALSMIAGVGLCILSVIPLFLSIGLGQNNNWRLIAAVGLLLIIASFGVFFFIYSGNIQGSFSKLLTNGRGMQPTPEQYRQGQVMNKINGIFWPIVLLVYFFWSFKTGNWHFTWVIFPIGGIIETIIRGVVGISDRE